MEGTLFKVKIGEDIFIFEYVYKKRKNIYYISPDINLAFEGFIFCIFRIRELRVFTGKRVLDPLACHVPKENFPPYRLIQKVFQPQLQVFLQSPTLPRREFFSKKCDLFLKVDAQNPLGIHRI